MGLVVGNVCVLELSKEVGSLYFCCSRNLGGEMKVVLGLEES